MCTQHSSKNTKVNYLFFIYLIMIAAGIFSGLSDIGLLKIFGTVISDIFIKIFKCISLPIIALSIIVTLSSYNNQDGSMKKLWQRTLLYTVSTTLIAASISCLLYLIIKPSNVSNVSNIIQTSGKPIILKTNYLEYLSTLLPSNILSPFIEHQIAGVLLISIVVGIAVRYIPEQKPRQSVVDFFKGIHSLFLVITRWIVAIIPLGLYGFTTTTVIQLRSGVNIVGIGEYLAITVLANLFQGFVVLPAWLKLNDIKPFAAMRKMSPALSLAFFSKSSAGTLPVTIETIEKNLKINPQNSRFILPLCTSINMNGCAIFIFTTVIYLMQNHGITITFSNMLLWIIVATIAAIGNAGVPMGCFFLSASLLSSMNVPILLLGIILPFYSILDMMETALNVWSDSCVTLVADTKMKRNQASIISENENNKLINADTL